MSKKNPEASSKLFLGYAPIQSLRRAADIHGASEAELAAIDRLEEFHGEQVDIDRLRPLAALSDNPTLLAELDRVIGPARNLPVNNKESK